jgi:hypothetical protein
MTRRISIVAAVAGLALTSFATAETRVVYLGGHEPARLVQVQERSDRAPYALTGSRSSKPTRVETIWVGNRFAGTRVVNK